MRFNFYILFWLVHLFTCILPCLPAFVHVYLSLFILFTCFTVFIWNYLCLPVFICLSYLPVWLYLPMFTFVYLELPLLTCMYLFILFTCLTVFTHVYLLVPLLTCIPVQFLGFTIQSRALTWNDVIIPTTAAVTDSRNRTTARMFIYFSVFHSLGKIIKFTYLLVLLSECISVV